MSSTETKRKKCQYTEEELSKALEAIRSGKENFQSASHKFNIPRTTLHDKIHNRSSDHLGVPGPPSVLTPEVEKIFVQWILKMQSRGFPVSKEELIDSVHRYVVKNKLQTSFTGNRPGRTWCTNFLKRNPMISERSAQNLTKNRSSVTELQLRKWFTDVGTYVEEEGCEDIFFDPSRWWNTDETGVMLCPKTGKVLVKRGSKAVYSFVSNDEKECITTLITGNANGDLAPPMIVFKLQRLPSSLSDSIPEEWGVGRSENGWMTGPTFYGYMVNIFEPYLEANKIQRPVIFFMDGHSSHLTLELSEFCSKAGIILVALYPNSTHVLQPLDVAFFHPLKVEWRKQVKKYRLENDGQNVHRNSFASVLQSTLENMDIKTILQSGFRSTGLYPFNPDAIDYEKYLMETNSAVDSLDSSEFETCDEKLFLRTLEKKLGEKIALFEQCSSDLIEIVEDRSLYQLWKKCKITVGEMEEVVHREEEAPSMTDILQSQPIFIQKEDGSYVPLENVEDLTDLQQELQSGLQVYQINSDHLLDNGMEDQNFHFDIACSIVGSSDMVDSTLNLDIGVPHPNLNVQQEEPYLIQELHSLSSSPSSQIVIAEPSNTVEPAKQSVASDPAMPEPVQPSSSSEQQPSTSNSAEVPSLIQTSSTGTQPLTPCNHTTATTGAKMSKHEKSQQPSEKGECSVRKIPEAFKNVLHWPGENPKTKSKTAPSKRQTVKVHPVVSGKVWQDFQKEKKRLKDEETEKKEENKKRREEAKMKKEEEQKLKAVAKRIKQEKIEERKMEMSRKKEAATKKKEEAQREKKTAGPKKTQKRPSKPRQRKVNDDKSAGKDEKETDEPKQKKRRINQNDEEKLSQEE